MANLQNERILNQEHCPLSEMEFLNTAEQAAREAGAVLLSWSKRFTVNQKTGHADLVTEADFASQKIVFETLQSAFPKHGFLGEEGLVAKGDSPYRWIIDPLDGTANYVHGYPHYAVSIGLEKAGKLVLGVIFDPNRDELFTAVDGHGAKLNGEPLQVSSVTGLRQSMVVASFPPQVLADNPAIQRFLHVLPHTQTIQRTGSAALNLSYLAAGRIDAFWSSSLKPWDIAAGVVIVNEAGGRVTRMNGAPLNIDIPDLLSSNGSMIHDELAKLLSAV